MPSVGRKFLLAGVGGMNITHSEAKPAFLSRYGQRREEIARLLAEFDAEGAIDQHDDCFLVKVRARDAEHLGELLKSRIGRIKGVRSTRTTIVLGTLKETQQLPLSESAG